MIAQLVASFIASAGFGILFSVPRKTLIQCGLVGMFGWMLYILSLKAPLGPVAATLIASFAVTVISQLFAKWFRSPITVFSVSGIIPLVPGGLAYDAMRNVVENRYELAVPLAAKAFMLSGAIAVGLVFSEVILLVIRKSKI